MINFIIHLGEGNLISCSTDPTDTEFCKIKKIIILILTTHKIIK